MKPLRSVLRPPVRGMLRSGSAKAPFVGVLDLLSVQPVAAWSVARRLTRTYDGPLIRLRRASDDAEMDFGADGASIEDGMSVGTFLEGSSGAGSVWFDQSGNGNKGTMASAQSQPSYAPQSDTEFPSWNFGGGATAQRFNAVPKEGLNNLFHGGGTLVLVMEMSGTADRILSKGSYGQGWEVARSGSGVAFVHALQVSNAQRSVTATPIVGSPVLITMTYDGGSNGSGVAISINGTPVRLTG